MPQRRTITAHIRQSDLTVRALEIVNEAGGFLRTPSLRERLREHFRPTGEDIAPFPSQDEPRFNQIVRNLVSNRHMQRSMFSMGYASWANRGIQITPAGRRFLLTVPR